MGLYLSNNFYELTNRTPAHTYRHKTLVQGADRLDFSTFFEVVLGLATPLLSNQHKESTSDELVSLTMKSYLGQAFRKVFNSTLAAVESFVSVA